MRRLVDILRFVVISPEILVFAIVTLLSIGIPSLFEGVISIVHNNLSCGVTGAAAPVAMLVWGWTQCWELLSPTEAQRVLLDWPDYPMLRDRAIACLAWCGLGSGIGFIGVVLMSGDAYRDIGVGVFLGGILAAVTATASLGLARLKLRELLIK